MNIILYHFGYRGDILVVGQNFTRELRTRYPEATIDLMVRPRMAEVKEFMAPLELYNNILLGEMSDFNNQCNRYDLSYIIDDKVYPEGNLRTPFTKAAFPFRQHRLVFTTTSEDKALADTIAKDLIHPIIATQSDMGRKWPEEQVSLLHRRLSNIGTLLTLGPEQIYPGICRPLTFRESAALTAHADIFVGIDSGIAHAAALMGVQTVLLPPVFPEYWISPTEYLNPFIADERQRHISVRPPKNAFCGHYFCLIQTSSGKIKRPSGNPLLVKCRWKKRFGVFKTASCFNKISVDYFYNEVVVAMKKRNLLANM